MKRLLAAIVAATLGSLAFAVAPASAATIESASGNDWDVNESDGSIGDGGQDTFDGWGDLAVRVAAADGTVVVSEQELSGFAMTVDDSGRRLETTTPVEVNDTELFVSRSIWAPADTDYIRYIDTFENRSGALLQVSAGWGGNLGSDSDTTVVTTEDGDRVYTAADQWMVLIDCDTDCDKADPAAGEADDPPLGYALGSDGNVFQQRPGEWYDNPFVDPWEAEGDPAIDSDSSDGLTHVFDFDLPAGATARLAYFALRTVAEDEATPNGDPEPADGSEIAKVVAAIDALQESPNFSDLDATTRNTIINWGAPTGTAVSLSHATTAPGTTVRVSGGNCGSGTGYSATISLSQGDRAPISSVTAPAGANGSFSALLPVPADAAAGSYTITTTCRLDDEAIFSMTRALTVATPTVTVAPEAGPPGSTVKVSATLCVSGESGTYRSVISLKSGSVVLDSETVTPAADGAVSASLTVPAGTDDGTYTVSVTCERDGSAVLSYTAGSFVVVADLGYRMVAADGGIFTFGDRDFHGSTGDLKLNKPIVGGATDVSDNDGYWIVASDGGVFTFNAEFHGSLGGQTLSSPAVEIEPTPTGKGYWIVLADGKVYTFGDANHFGDMSGKALNKPVIGMSVTPSGQGYWLVAEDGGIFNFGDARFFGSMGDKTLNAPVIDLAPSVDNQGYYLLGRDGGVFTFGSADFKGSTGAMTLNSPVIAMLVAPNGAGYWLAASDGGVFTFGSIPFLGSMGGTKLNSPVLDLIS